MLAVILAAGTSTRLRPLTDRIPKPLIPVCGRTILQRSIDNLLAVGVDEIVIVTGYLGDQIPAAVRAWYPDLTVRYVGNPDYATTGNGNSLLHARGAVAGREFLLLDGDVIYQAEVVQAVQRAAAPDALALFCSRQVGHEEMKVALDGDGTVRLISKEIPPASAAGESIGIERFCARTSTYLFETLVERIVHRGGSSEFYEHSFQEIVDRGLARIAAVEVDRWYCDEIDDPSDLARVESEMQARGLV